MCFGAVNDLRTEHIILVYYISLAQNKREFNRVLNVQSCIRSFKILLFVLFGFFIDSLSGCSRRGRVHRLITRDITTQNKSLTNSIANKMLLLNVVTFLQL